jgi:hypothetical protein
MKSYFADQIEALRSNNVYYAVIDAGNEIEYQKVNIQDIDMLDSALVFDSFEGTVPLFKIHSSY